MLPEVQFKCTHRYLVLDESLVQGVEVGAFVVVEADRGEDLGIVVFVAARDSPLAVSLHSGQGGEDGALKKILRLASVHDRADLPRKAKDEMDVLTVISRTFRYRESLCLLFSCVSTRSTSVNSIDGMTKV